MLKRALNSSSVSVWGFHSERKKLEKKKAADAGKIAKKVPGLQANEKSILQLTHEHITEMQTFDSEEAFFTARGERDFKGGSPYMIKCVPTINSLAQHRVVRQPLGIFKIQFPTSQMAKDLHRGDQSASQPVS